MHLTTEKISKFIGSDIKIQATEKTHFLRGNIKTAIVEGNILTVEFWWLAKTINNAKDPDEWKNIDNPYPWIVDLGKHSTQCLNGMIILVSAATLKTTIILPPNGDKLNPTRVAGLECR